MTLTSFQAELAKIDTLLNTGVACFFWLLCGTSFFHFVCRCSILAREHWTSKSWVYESTVSNFFISSSFLLILAPVAITVLKYYTYTVCSESVMTMQRRSLLQQNSTCLGSDENFNFIFFVFLYHDHHNHHQNQYHHGCLEKMWSCESHLFR